MPLLTLKRALMEILLDAGSERRLADLQQPPSAADWVAMADGGAPQCEGGHDLCGLEGVRFLPFLPTSRMKELTRGTTQIRELGRRAQHGYDSASDAEA